MTGWLRVWLSVALSAGLFNTGQCHAGDPLQPLIAASTDRPEVAAIAAMSIMDDTEWVAGFHGFRHVDKDGVQLHVDRETLFRFASVSKLVVAIGFMQLVEKGRIGLDEDVSPHLGFTLRNPASEHPITARMLLSHTSSIRDTGGYFLPPEQPIAAFFTSGSDQWHDGSHYDMQHPPEDNFFQYCNLNYGLLGTLIERLSGQRFDHYMREAVLEPLGLTGGFNPEGLDAATRSQLSVLYRSQDGAWVVQADDLPNQSEVVTERYADYEIGSNATAFSPQGGLRISVPGMARIAQLMIHRGELNGVRLLQAATVEEMERTHWRFDPATTNGDTSGGTFLAFGLGVHLFTGQRLANGGDMLAPGVGDGWKGHLGEAYGLLSGMLYHPENREALIYVINGTPYDIGAYPGEYSSFYRWEERVLTTLLGGRASPTN